MDRRSFTAMLAATSGTAMVPSPGWARLQLSARQGFITRAANGDLKEGNKTFRYIGADMPEVTHIRTDWDLEQGRRFRLPTKDELDWIVEAAAQGNFKVVRTWCFPSYFQPELPDDIHYLRTNSDGVTVTINKTGFRLFDYFLARCGELGVRAQVPFVYLIGRVRQWDDADGDPHPQMLDFVRQVILRRNTVNGIQYRDDPAIFAWESGNESKPTARWITALAAYVKRMDPNHLFVDGRWGASDVYDSYSAPLLAENRDIDIVSFHTYEKLPKGWSTIEAIRNVQLLLRGQNRALGIGEISPNTTVSELEDILGTVVTTGVSGASWWSFKGARAKGGYTQWNGKKWGGNDDLKWPGFHSPLEGVATEKAKIDLLTAAAFAIEGRSRPLRLPMPTAPKLLPIKDVGHINWIPGTGEQTADIERSTRRDGGFTVVRKGFETFKGSTYDLFSDETAEVGRTYFYRVRSRNTDGASPYSNVVGPVRVHQCWLIDDLWDLSKASAGSANCEFLSSYDLVPYHSDLSVLTTTGGSAWIDYTLPGEARSFRIISNNDTADLHVEGSSDGRDWRRLPAGRRLYPPLHPEFDGHPRVVYIGEGDAGDRVRHLRVRFGNNDAISRVEIAHT